VSESKSQAKPFEISKWMVWEAYQRVKANQGAAGVDGCTIEQYVRHEAPVRREAPRTEGGARPPRWAVAAAW